LYLYSVKVFFQKIGAIVLAALIVVATTSFSVRMHYCGTHLVSVTLNQAAKKCYNFPAKNCETSFKVPKKSCCHDIEFVKSAEDSIKKSEQFSFSVEKKLSLNHNFILKSTPKTTHKVCRNFFPTHYLPLISINRQVLYQVFLI